MKEMFQAGTYHVRAKGHNGSLPVTLSSDRLEKIDVDSSKESKGISYPVFTTVPSSIIEGQALNVDTVSGATISSLGIIEGVADAIREAGGDPEIFKKRPKPKKEAGEAKDLTTDVVVIGGGGAGLAAAATVLQNNKKVILLEKFPALGGNTIRTGGPMNAADPEWQKEFSALAGEAHTLENIAATDEKEIDPEYLEDFRQLKKEIHTYLEKTKQGENCLFDSTLLHRIQTYLGGKRTDLNGNKVYGNYDLVKKLTDHALESVHWLAKIGVDFDKGTVEMPVGAVWRREHRPKADQGYAFISALEKYVTNNGGEILLDARATELLTDENGRMAASRENQSPFTRNLLSLPQVVLVPTLRCCNNTIPIGKELMTILRPLISLLLQRTGFV